MIKLVYQNSFTNEEAIESATLPTSSLVDSHTTQGLSLKVYDSVKGRAYMLGTAENPISELSRYFNEKELSKLDKDIYIFADTYQTLERISTLLPSARKYSIILDLSSDSILPGLIRVDSFKFLKTNKDQHNFVYTGRDHDLYTKDVMELVMRKYHTVAIYRLLVSDDKVELVRTASMVEGLTEEKDTIRFHVLTQKEDTYRVHYIPNYLKQIKQFIKDDLNKIKKLENADTACGR